MTEKSFPLGIDLHFRPSVRLTQLAGGFQSEIVLVRDGLAVNAKNWFDLSAVLCMTGAWVTITASGPDEGQAVLTLSEYLSGRMTDEF